LVVAAFMQHGGHRMPGTNYVADATTRPKQQPTSVTPLLVICVPTRRTNYAPRSRKRRPYRLCFESPDGDGGSAGRASMHIDWIAASI
jgi:hypothetical protein